MLVVPYGPAVLEWEGAKLAEDVLVEGFAVGGA